MKILFIKDSVVCPSKEQNEIIHTKVTVWKFDLIKKNLEYHILLHGTSFTDQNDQGKDPLWRNSWNKLGMSQAKLSHIGF